ncbi:hypothetical protein SOVF_135580, partial [Spinacia oleracea]
SSYQQKVLSWIKATNGGRMSGCMRICLESIRLNNLMAAGVEYCTCNSQGTGVLGLSGTLFC